MSDSVLAAPGGKDGVRSRALRSLRLRSSDIDRLLAGLGEWLARNQRTIHLIQWLVVGIYFTLLITPVLLPLPGRLDHIWSHLTLASQFVFWGIWWPFVLLSMMLVGRVWCGVFCPEGSISEAVSAHSRGYAIPGWIKWKGWPFVAFALTTIYGQMISVYQYPKAALALLGFSTVGAIGTALFYGRNKRIWCRYLCPVTGVFAVLSKLAPVHYQVDTKAWNAWEKPRGATTARVNCAPLVAIGTMQGNAACHMCGRCSGFRGAVTLARRSPNHEIIHVAGTETSAVQTLVILFGLLGLAATAFHWGSSSLYIDIKQALAEWLIGQGVMWPLEVAAPWWILTNYPDQNDVMTLLDGTVMIGYMVGLAALLGTLLGGCVALATRALGRWSWVRFHHIVQSLIPLAGCGVFLGLSMTTITLLHNDGFATGFVGPLRGAVLLGAACWSLWLGWRITARYNHVAIRRIAAMLPLSIAVVASGLVWATLFWPIGRLVSSPWH